ncbi:hypothetical protein GUITHDRAFT_149960 [Guillardia theta CCMP2712]|uniref:Uncharacterized protein n=2 Tax=Guillardia theta TaxID=55529 RepID=L1K3B2_GUITC|nr:hypothetical protein GUITHDRAFT_149960 [Guillardia theta CCMP2712]EKX55104.1 hypothetical protein GUITHDRAFT_149960 [Guillardia theta CCMP2712]|eukprot:XP_005842084.1 hypothetical protein GUITHDRAFT_149960 [Guillardia theta CCMP2712]
MRRLNFLLIAATACLAVEANPTCPQPCAGYNCTAELLLQGQYSKFSFPDGIFGSKQWDIRVVTRDSLITQRQFMVQIFDSENFLKFSNNEANVASCNEWSELNHFQLCLSLQGNKCRSIQSSSGSDMPYTTVVVSCGAQNQLNCNLDISVKVVPQENTGCKAGSISCGALGGILAAIIIVILVAMGSLLYRRRNFRSREFEINAEKTSRDGARSPI